MRGLLLMLAALALGAAPTPVPAEAPTSDEGPPRWSVRSRLFMRLDPTLKPNPDGTAEPSALGQFRLLARPPQDGVEAEAAGWLGHAPGAAPFADDAVAGDVTTLRMRATWERVWLEGGRHWTTIGGLRLTRLTGVTAGIDLGQGFDASARLGLSGEEAHEFLGENLDFGGEVRARLPGHLRLTAGVLGTRPQDGATRTRWTGAVQWIPQETLEGRAAATLDATGRALVEGRVELMARPIEVMWLRGYGRYAALDQILPFGDLLAVFAPDPRGELGGLAEWAVWEALQLRLDAAWVGIRDDHTGGRLRAGIDMFPAVATRLTFEATATSTHTERTGLLRLAGRAPIKGSVFGTLETLADFIEGREPGGVGRVGAGFEPWAGWFAYGAVEVGRSERWEERLAGLVMLEHALGAPVRWGGAP